MLRFLDPPSYPAVGAGLSVFTILHVATNSQIVGARSFESTKARRRTARESKNPILGTIYLYYQSHIPASDRTNYHSQYEIVCVHLRQLEKSDISRLSITKTYSDSIIAQPGSKCEMSTMLTHIFAYVGPPTVFLSQDSKIVISIYNFFKMVRTYLTHTRWDSISGAKNAENEL